MKTNIEELYNNINLVLKQYSKSVKIANKVADTLMEKNIMKSDIDAVYRGAIPIETVDRRFLYVFTKALFEATGEPIIDPKKYFTEIEIEEGDKYVVENKVNDNEPIVVFENVEKIDDDYYVTNMTAQQVKDLYDRMIVTYNKETQRNTVLKQIKNSVIDVINVNQKSVQEMADLMVKGLFIRNTITFNILKTGKEEFEYNEKEKTLTVYNTKLDILDGYHRSLAMIRACTIDPELHYITGVNITNFDVEKARRFITQEDKKNKINPKHIKALEENLENAIVKKINESSRCDLKGKITTNVRAIALNIAIVEQSILADSIKEFFTYKTRREADEIANYLIEGFNEIIGLYPDEFLTNYATVKKYSVINHSNTFIGYVALLAELKGKSNWKEVLADTLESIDFSIDNPDWEKIGMFKNRIRKYDITAIQKYFLSFIKEGGNKNE